MKTISSFSTSASVENRVEVEAAALMFDAMGRGAKALAEARRRVQERRNFMLVKVFLFLIDGIVAEDVKITAQQLETMEVDVDDENDCLLMLELS
jgi:hypothetical protein